MLQILVVLLFAGLVFAYVVYPWLGRWGTTAKEAASSLPGDDIVPSSTIGYTLAISIEAKPSEIWPWLVQMGQGRGGFYTHVWVENLLAADIHNAERVVPELQSLDRDDRVRLTPDPYLGGPGQYLEVEVLEPEEALVFRQRMPNGTRGTWAFALYPRVDRTTRVLFRRRGERASLFDRIMLPGYVFMDRGMLSGLKIRAERMHRERSLSFAR